MSFLRSLFSRRARTHLIDHPIFGRMAFSRQAAWRNPAFALWGYSTVDLLIDAPPTGPTRVQEEAFIRFRESRSTLLPRCLDALAAVREAMSMPKGEFSVAGLSIPSLTDSRAGKLWTLWFDCVGDEHFGYGVQSEDDWKTLSGFADD